MSWIQTFTGRQFFPLDPQPDAINIRDIAHSLSLQCRFAGHCKVFYSVAEHSVRVSHEVPREHALWGLLHDAAEAYLTDLPSPIKRQLPAYREAEGKVMEAIAERFGLSWPEPDEVRHADKVLLATEARDLMSIHPNTWESLPDALPDAIHPWPAGRAKARFLTRMLQLGGEHV